MKYYLVSQTSITYDDGNHLYNDTEHFLLKLENEDNKYYPDYDYESRHNDYHDHQMTELTENQFNSLKDTFEIREFLMK